MIAALYVTEVDQGRYGHRARKRTWLYVVAPKLPPPLDWTVASSDAIVSGFTHQPKALTSRANNAVYVPPRHRGRRRHSVTYC